FSRLPSILNALAFRNCCERNGVKCTVHHLFYLFMVITVIRGWGDNAPFSRLPSILNALAFRNCCERNGVKCTVHHLFYHFMVITVIHSKISLKVDVPSIYSWYTLFIERQKKMEVIKMGQQSIFVKILMVIGFFFAASIILSIVMGLLGGLLWFGIKVVLPIAIIVWIVKAISGPSNRNRCGRRYY
ncbi:hypothetical protein, partial [Enterococcus rivorum]